MKAGNVVQAVERISERNFKGKPEFIHAECGDFGLVEDVTEDGEVNVRFFSTGTMTLCSDCELKVVFEFAPQSILDGLRRYQH